MIIAHRGESYDAPENTMAAINLAWERGAEAVEIDIRLSRDNQIVVIHDFKTKRLAGVNKKVKDQTFEELRKLDVGLWKDPVWIDERIPSLKEVLDSVPHEKKLIIEIKSSGEIIPFLKETLENSNLKTHQVELIGFNLTTMSMAKKEFPATKVLWLLDLDYYWYAKIFNPSISKAIKKALDHQLDGLNVWAGSMLKRELVDQVKATGLLLYTWTINDIAMARKLVDFRVDAITTDRTKWLKSQF